MFYLLSNYRISKLIRPFSFWGYIGVMMLDGNQQIIFFLMFSQSSLLFSLDFSDKVQHFVSNLVFFFFFLWFSVTCYFLYYKLYKKLAKYFLDNAKCSINGILCLTICSSFRQLILSSVHNFLRYDYKVQLITLTAVEVAYILAIIYFFKVKKTFLQISTIWVSILFSYIRVLLNFCLYFQQEN